MKASIIVIISTQSIGWVQWKYAGTWGSDGAIAKKNEDAST